MVAWVLGRSTHTGESLIRVEMRSRLFPGDRKTFHISTENDMQWSRSVQLVDNGDCERTNENQPPV